MRIEVVHLHPRHGLRAQEAGRQAFIGDEQGHGRCIKVLKPVLPLAFMGENKTLNAFRPAILSGCQGLLNGPIGLQVSH